MDKQHLTTTYETRIDPISPDRHCAHRARGADHHDPAGFLAICIVTTFMSIVIATAAAVFEKMLHSAVEIKSENDLTV